MLSQGWQKFGLWGRHLPLYLVGVVKFIVHKPCDYARLSHRLIPQEDLQRQSSFSCPMRCQHFLPDGPEVRETYQLILCKGRHTSTARHI